MQPPRAEASCDAQTAQGYILLEAPAASSKELVKPQFTRALEASLGITAPADSGGARTRLLRRRDRIA